MYFLVISLYDWKVTSHTQQCAYLMRVNLLLFTSCFNGRLHAVSVEKPSKQISNFWTVQFLKLNVNRILVFRTSLVCTWSLFLTGAPHTWRQKSLMLLPFQWLSQQSKQTWRWYYVHFSRQRLSNCSTSPFLRLTFRIRLTTYFYRELHFYWQWCSFTLRLD